MSNELHRPVLLNEVCDILRPVAGKCYLDCTVGAGGHAERILALSQPDGKLIGLDRDPQALAAAAQRLERFGDRVVLVHANFADAAAILTQGGISTVHGVLFDLGLSSIQLDASGRGFSFTEREAPLDMRADPTTGPTAADLIARASEQELANVLWQFADERHSRRIAGAICRERQTRPIRTVGQLLDLIERVAGARRSRLHPATRTLLALRMWTNAELTNLDAALRQLPLIVEPGGRAIVISFHSKEDRIAKTVLRDQERDGLWRILTKHPLMPSTEEVRANPRARSAKLRAVERKGVV